MANRITQFPEREEEEPELKGKIIDRLSPELLHQMELLKIQENFGFIFLITDKSGQIANFSNILPAMVPSFLDKVKFSLQLEQAMSVQRDLFKKETVQ